jgi:hypothetical protein
LADSKIILSNAFATSTFTTLVPPQAIPLRWLVKSAQSYDGGVFRAMDADLLYGGTQLSGKDFADKSSFDAVKNREFHQIRVKSAEVKPK